MRSNYRYKHLAALAATASLSLGTAMLHAQGTNASMSGVVTDASGAAVASATVVVKNTGTAATRTVTTDTAGRYEITNLIPGSYEVSAEAPGFSKKLLTGITLQVGQQAGENIALAVGQNTDTVSVEATETLTQTESSENGTVIENKKVVELPLANRQFYALALLSPGVYQPAQTSTLGFRGGFNVAGATEETNYFTYNGTYNSSMGTQQPGYRPSVETIQEFKIQTGVYGAQYGRYSGGQIIVLEKSGSNTFHGSAYEFIRNQYTDAKPFFTAANSPNPAFKQNTFGGTIGGPIFKDKTFFFGGFEGQNVNTTATQLTTVPTNANVNGLFLGKIFNPYTGAVVAPQSDGYVHASDIVAAAGAAQPTAAAALAQGLAFAQYYPSANAAAPGLNPNATTNNYTFSATQVESMKEFTVRIDHTFSVSDNMNTSYQEFHDPTNEPNNTLCGSATVPNGGCQFNQVVHLVTLQEAHTFSPNLLNVFSFGYNRFQMPRTPEDSTLPGTLPSLPGVFATALTAPNRGLPNLAPTGFATLGGPTNIPQNQWLNQYSLVDSLNWNHGAHSFKFGVEGFLAITTELYIQTGRGAATFNTATLAGKTVNNCSATVCYGTTGSTVADFIMGLPATTSRNPLAPNVHEGMYGFYGYLVDDWKIKNNLTLNIGLRYEMNSPAYDSKNVISRFNPNATNGLGTKGTIEVGTNTAIPAGSALANYFSTGPTFKYLYNFDWNNFAPRIGFAWQPMHKDTTVVKGAYGIFYNGPIMFNQYISASTQLPERAPQTFSTVGATLTGTGCNLTAAGCIATPDLTLAAPFRGQSPTTLSGGAGTYTLFAVQPTQPTPYIHEWSMGVQQAFTNSLVFELTYFGSHGSHLANSRSINTVPLGTTGIQANRVYPQWGTISYANDQDSSSYNSLQASLKQAYKNGISYLIAYTYGHSIDQNGGTGSSSNSSSGFQDPNHPERDRSLSDFNVKHRIAISPVLELPFGKGKHYLNSGIGSAVFGGFQLSGIIQFQTGRPFTVVDSASNTSATFAGADRPNLVPGQDPNNGPKTIAKWFNTAAYTLQAAGTFGNSPRNGVIGPNFTEVDATLARQFPIFERFKGQIRIEAFNLLNHPNFFNPFSASTQYVATQTAPSTQTSTSFGTITNAYNPRELQGAVRITF